MKLLITLILSICFIINVYAESNQQLYLYIEGSYTPVPTGWYIEYKKSPNLFIVFAPAENEKDTFQENYNLVMEYLPKVYSISNYMTASVIQLKNVYTDFKILKTGTNYHIYQGKLGDNQLKQMQYFFIKEKTAYILTFSALLNSFGDYEEIFISIAENFSLKE
ncbi:MAG TPA: hypothetical protein DC057_17305 [Spirochaetia bacterium]|nr:hypothetical protein [Spirochaetia bacterium]